MAMINCPDCRHAVSTMAKTCPNCGRGLDIWKGNQSLRAVVIVLMMIAAVTIGFLVIGFIKVATSGDGF